MSLLSPTLRANGRMRNKWVPLGVCVRSQLANLLTHFLSQSSQLETALTRISRRMPVPWTSLSVLLVSSFDSSHSRSPVLNILTARQRGHALSRIF